MNVRSLTSFVSSDTERSQKASIREKKKTPKTMPYYTKDEDEVDDFNEYDPMPYSGGYDITVTYGRAIAPSDETCYPLSSRSGDAFEYQRPVFSSNHEPAAYGDQALNTEYSSYARPKTRPGGHGGAHVEGAYGGKKPEYGGSGSDFGRKPDSGYGGRTEVEYGRRPESAGYGGRTEVEYGRKPESENDGDYRKPSYGHLKDEDDKKESEGHKKYSGKEFDDEKSKTKEKKKDKKKDSEDDEKKKNKNKDHHDDEKKKIKDHHDDYDEKKKKKNKDDHDDYDDKKKKNKDHYDDKKKNKDDYDDKKKKKDHHGSDDEKKNKKDKHHKGHREYDD